MHAEEHNVAPIANAQGVTDVINIELNCDSAWEMFTISAFHSSGLEVKERINYCPFCGRKLTEE